MASVNRVILQKKQDRTADFESFPEDIGSHGLLMIFKKYNYESPGARGVLNPSVLLKKSITNSILLPLPNQLQDNLAIRTNRADLGITGDLVALAAKRSIEATRGGVSSVSEVGDIIGSMSSALKNSIDVDAITKAISTFDTSKLAENIRFLGRRGLDNLGVGKSFEAGVGNTINPKAALTFEGVEFKTHTLDWTFYPRSSNESNKMKKIMHILRKNVLPEYGGPSGFQKALLKYPSMVDLFLVGVDSSHFYYFKTAMINQLGTNYTPGGIAILKGGRPASINLSIQLTEMDIHTAEDYYNQNGNILE